MFRGMLAEHFTEDEQMEILALAMSESDLDFVSLIRETMDDLCRGTMMSDVQIYEIMKVHHV